MAAIEVATGHVAGFEPPPAAPVGPRRPVAPRRALELAILPALERPPCLVAFSGGRDSSAVLAVAVALARREGLPEPVPATKLHPGIPATEESDWQQMVVDHLGLTDWVRLPVGAELDLVGPVAAHHLLRHGVLWPPFVHSNSPIVDAARGGSVLTGEGGDEVFGDRRVSALRQAFTGPRLRARRSAALLAGSIGPPPVRRWVKGRSRRATLDWRWLRPSVRQQFLQTVLEDDLGEPLNWISGTRRLLRRRSWAHGARTMALLAADGDVAYVHPLLDAGFLESLATPAGYLGLPGRTEAMRRFFGDLLPDAILERESKAFFNAVTFNAHARAFAGDWDGTGVDTDLVDADKLRDEWMSPGPHAASSALLQTAWLATANGATARAGPDRAAPPGTR